MMNKDKKKIYIKEMKDFFTKTGSVFVTHYQGLTVKQIDELRSEMRKHGIFFKITKKKYEMINFPRLMVTFWSIFNLIIFSPCPFIFRFNLLAKA